RPARSRCPGSALRPGHESRAGRTRSGRRQRPAWKGASVKGPWVMKGWHEECGVFAAVGVPNAAEVTCLGLHALQHRGQESSGIVSSDERGEFHTHKGIGLVSEVFDDHAILVLPGSMAIGHNRYSTTGSLTRENTQPLVVVYRGGSLALAHNGNLVNARELREGLEGSGSIFQTTLDTEIFLHLMARSRHDDPAEALIEAARQVRGAYAMVLLTSDHALAIRDPYGFRPLCLGRIGNHYVGRTFIQPQQRGRDSSVRVKFNPVREILADRRVVLVDDSIVRGTTSRKLVRMLKRNGARAVHFRIGSPPVRYPCFYGIDTPSRRELIGALKSPEEIREYLGADSIGYLSLAGLLACERDGTQFCHACFSGEYPIPVDPGLGKLAIEQMHRPGDVVGAP